MRCLAVSQPLMLSHPARQALKSSARFRVQPIEVIAKWLGIEKGRDLLGQRVGDFLPQKLRCDLGERNGSRCDEAIVLPLVDTRVEHATGLHGNEPCDGNELKTYRIRVIATDDMDLFSEGDQQLYDFFPSHVWNLPNMPMGRVNAQPDVSKQYRCGLWDWKSVSWSL